MQKVLKLFLLSLLILPAFVFADVSLTFDHSSPRQVDTLIISTCDVGDTVTTYDDTDTLVDSFACDGANTFTSSDPLTMTIVECDSMEMSANCNTALLGDMLTDPGFVSSAEYTFVEDYPVSSIGSCPDVYQVCYYDWLVVNLVIIFLLSLMVMGFFIDFFGRKTL